MESANFIEMGKDLGLQGQELLEFAKEREKQKGMVERQRKREHEKEMKEYELKIAETMTSKTNGSSAVTLPSTTKSPKLPVFKDNIDGMYSYLLRFERFAKDAGWPRESWATSLGALLTGKALEYNDLKWALLFKYLLTADGFRRKFRNARCESGETYFQFLYRIEGYLTRRIELSDTKKTYVNLLQQEQ
ncbi:hypothetical protein HOLleu_20780 [Holothuria leucospilota]|uniref:Uncharacterized protein n=1 Tax=Holothuria leucospilota TaxID=206669 RepID=A0A9Q1C181_HOLLE|nr:hypothetical protein HOLleu_20780 [Holothuria leucospilota]